MATLNENRGSDGNSVRNVDDDQFEEWRLRCIESMKAKMESNVAARSRRVEEVVNECIGRIHRELQISDEGDDRRFTIPHDVMTQSLRSMSQRLDEWNGVKLLWCKRVPRCFASYHLIGENWWNRQKGSWFGDFYFLPLFQCLAASGFSDLVFIHILSAIMESNITFKRSRPQPLCPDQSLQKSADLKAYFGRLLGVEMDSKSTLKIREMVMDRINELKEIRFTQYIQLRNQQRTQSPNYSVRSQDVNGKQTEIESVPTHFDDPKFPHFRPPPNRQFAAAQHEDRCSIPPILSAPSWSAMVSHSSIDTVSSTDTPSGIPFDSFPQIPITPEFPSFSPSGMIEADPLFLDDPLEPDLTLFGGADLDLFGDELDDDPLFQHFPDSSNSFCF